MALAHSANAAGKTQDLSEHLQNVARAAAEFAEPWGGAALADAAGWLHDIGKLDPAFQAYLAQSRRVPGMRRGPDHKGAGALLAVHRGLHPLAMLVQGHHGGMTSPEMMRDWLAERRRDQAVQGAMRTARAQLPELERALATALAHPLFGEDALESELLMRMLFSALVDADFLDTEQHFVGAQRPHRGGAPSVPWLAAAFDANHRTFEANAEPTELNAIRRQVYADGVAQAQLPPGFFTLTAPTGIGKTRLSLGFALHHAQRHGLRRIIYAIPYTSIIEQTAAEFRSVFIDPRAVLEHHTAIRPPEPGDTPTRDEEWMRLAAENWDGPLIVTTTVRLFESLFGATPSECRRLHRLARSVIILDEAQMLPTHVLSPILDVLAQLVARYGASVVLCTATQPAFDPRNGFPPLPTPREIVTDPPALFARLRRVRYDLPRSAERWSWTQAAEAMAAERQALAIVNTRADAVSLFHTLRDRLGDHNDSALFHLSTWMCGAHRRATLDEVRRRLAADEPCWLVSTQVVEAGVDLDFPLVLRALAPLDRIVQAAGRCNRNGRLPGGGRVIVFVPDEGHMPPGPYKTGLDETRTLLVEQSADLHDPTLYAHYFNRLYGIVPLDTPGIQTLRARLDFRETADRFHVIEDDTTPVIVDTYAPDVTDARIADLRLRRGSPRELLRALQPYIVGLRPNEVTRAQSAALLEDVFPTMYRWLGVYDARRGLVMEGGFEPASQIW